MNPKDPAPPPKRKGKGVGDSDVGRRKRERERESLLNGFEHFSWQYLQPMVLAVGADFAPLLFLFAQALKQFSSSCNYSSEM